MGQDVRFDYLVYEKKADDIIHNVKKYKSEIRIIPKFSIRQQKEYRARYAALLEAKQYDAVHLHTPVSALMHLKTAKEMNVPVRIMHSHNARLSDTLLKKLRNRIAISLGRKYADHYVACSDLAAKAVFGSRHSSEVVVLSNAVQLEKFTYSEVRRTEIRAKYGVGDAFVIFHAGRMCRQKNHEYLLRVFASVLKKRSDAKLLLLGQGSLREQLQQKVHMLGIADSVIFVGVVDNPQDYMSASDMLVMPSLYEGLPLVGLEAQVNGLPCIFSNTVTRQTKITERCTFLPLGNTKAWTAHILHNADIQRDTCRNEEVLREVSVEHQNNLLVQYYRKIISKA